MNNDRRKRIRKIYNRLEELLDDILNKKGMYEYIPNDIKNSEESMESFEDSLLLASASLEDIIDS